MPTVGAFFTHPDDTQRQRDVVVDDKQILDGNLLLIQPIFHRLATEVHIGGWLDHHKGFSSVLHLGNLGQTAGGEGSLKILSQSVSNAKTCIVPGVFIFGTDVSQTGDEVLHINNVET